MNFVAYINSFMPLPENAAEELLSKSRKDFLPKGYLGLMLFSLVFPLWFR